MSASSAPTSTVSSSSTLISRRVPATGEGISVSTLSVETSRSGSSTATSSPTDFNHRVTVPSVTDSPRAGSVTGVESPPPPPPPPEDFSSAAFSLAGAGSSSGSASAAACAVSSSRSSASASRPASPLCPPSESSESSESSVDSPPDSSPPPALSSASPTTASSAPTSTVSSSSTLISRRVPATGEGISVSTLSVETSRSGSSTATSSPTDFNHRVTVPSVTDSPSAGRLTEVAIRCDRSFWLLVPRGTGRRRPSLHHPCPFRQ